MESLHTAVLIVHVIGAAVIIGVSFVTFVIEFKKFSSKETLALTEFIWRIAGTAFGIQLLTGIYLAGSEWSEVGKTSYFWIKMFLFFVVGSLVSIINRRRFDAIKRNESKIGDGTGRALIGLLTFITIAALGVLIAESAH